MLGSVNAHDPALGLCAWMAHGSPDTAVLWARAAGGQSCFLSAISPLMNREAFNFHGPTLCSTLWLYYSQLVHWFRPDFMEALALEFLGIADYLRKWIGSLWNGHEDPVLMMEEMEADSVTRTVSAFSGNWITTSWAASDLGGEIVKSKSKIHTAFSLILKKSNNSLTLKEGRMFAVSFR